MFSWFFHRRRLANRNIFRFWDGTRDRAIDPAEAWRVMWEHPECNPQNDFGPATASGPDGTFDKEALARVLKMAREMFGVQPWSEDTPGLTVEETVGLLWAFLRYMETLKKKRGQSPTQSAPTVSESSPQPSIIPFESGSSSTSPEPKSDEPSSSSRRSVQL